MFLGAGRGGAGAGWCSVRWDGDTVKRCQDGVALVWLCVSVGVLGCCVKGGYGSAGRGVRVR